MLKKYLIFCFSVVFFIHLLGASEKIPQKTLQPLQNEIDKVLNRLNKEAKISIQIADINTGQILYERNARQRLIPSSSIKLLTAAAILDELGPSYIFETKLLTNGTIQGQKLLGDLFLQGAGDPSLKGRSLENLIFQLKLIGVKEIQGDLIFDATEFDELTLGPGWMWDEKIEYRNSPIDALTINHSCVKVWVRPSFDLKTPPYVNIQPEIPGIKIENLAKMEKIDVSKNTIEVTKLEKNQEDIILVSGKLSDQSEMLKFNIPVKNPLLYTATEFKERLNKNEIVHQGKIRFEAAPDDCQTLATHRSESLFKLIMYMMKNSDDLYANSFLKKLGSVIYGKPGTWPNGAKSLKDFLTEIDKKMFSDLTIMDGSGESSFNRMSAEQMVKFLTWASEDFIYSPELIASLPLSGVDQSFRKRLRDKFLKAKVRATAGSLNEVSSLNGYVMTQDGDSFAFSIFINDYNIPKMELKNEVEDRICYILAHFSRDS